ncbi:hypothetical protein [Celerinatantimonas sp. YJH-8]|uniref:hypothetical protein n=1 Tax=Celerinatantimonas sp. YJH-8 TaxID=3228714 RepID=UPI0038C7805B
MSKHDELDHLAKVLRDNRDKFFINNDGFITSSFRNPHVEAEIIRQLNQIYNHRQNHKKEQLNSH